MRDNTIQIPVHDINNMLPAEIEEIEAAIDEFAFQDRLEDVTSLFDEIAAKGGEVTGVSIGGAYLCGDEDFMLKNVVDVPNCTIHVLSAEYKDLALEVKDYQIPTF